MSAPLRERPKYATAAEIAADYGRTSRHWIRMAAGGKIPGAYQPGGAGHHWMFDRATFRRWWANQLREVPTWRGYTNGDRSGGRAPSVKTESTAEASKQRIRQLLNSA